MLKLPKTQRYNQHGASQKIVANTTSPEQEHNMKYMLTKTTKNVKVIVVASRNRDAVQ